LKFILNNRDELVEAVKTVGGPFMENEQWADMTLLEHMTLDTIPARFEVESDILFSTIIYILDNLHAGLL
jgi:hypothetical protein